MSIVLKAIVRRIDEGLVKDAFKHVVLRDYVLRHIDVCDIVDYMLNRGYSYERDGVYVELRLKRSDAYRLIQALYDLDFKITEEGNCITAFKNDSVALRLVLDDEEALVKTLDKKVLENVVRLEVEIQGKPLVEYFTGGLGLGECVHSFDVFYVLNPARMGLDVVADAYVYLLKRGHNRIPSNADIAESLLFRGIVNADFIKAYTHRSAIEALAISLGLELGINESEVELRKEGRVLLKGAFIYGQDLLRLVHLDPESMRQLGICINPIDLGSPNVVEYLNFILFRLK